MIVYTYRHNTVREPLSLFLVGRDFVFETVNECRMFMGRCLDERVDEFVIVGGTWNDGAFTGVKVVDL